MDIRTVHGIVERQLEPLKNQIFDLERRLRDLEPPERTVCQDCLGVGNILTIVKPEEQEVSWAYYKYFTEGTVKHEHCTRCYGTGHI